MFKVGDRVYFNGKAANWYIGDENHPWSKVPQGYYTIERINKYPGHLIPHSFHLHGYIEHFYLEQLTLRKMKLRRKCLGKKHE